jgi:peptidoglycan/xylan/chitin deacetylase (PgdA/CDA1 family)
VRAAPAACQRHLAAHPLSEQPRAIYLLHASACSNVNALAKAIHGLKTRGYQLATLDALRKSGRPHEGRSAGFCV